MPSRAVLPRPTLAALRFHPTDSDGLSTELIGKLRSTRVKLEQLHMQDFILYCLRRHGTPMHIRRLHRGVLHQNVPDCGFTHSLRLYSIQLLGLSGMVLTPFFPTFKTEPCLLFVIEASEKLLGVVDLSCTGGLNPKTQNPKPKTLQLSVVLPKIGAAGARP